VPASRPSWAANTGAGYRADPTPSGRPSEVRGTIDRRRALARVRAPALPEAHAESVTQY